MIVSIKEKLTENKKIKKIIKKNISPEKIVISKLCMEDYSYIPIIDIIKNSNNMNDIIIKVIKELYFNPNKKENNIL